MKGYVPRLRKLTQGVVSFARQRDIFLNDRYGASHFLLPVFNGSEDAFFTNGDDAVLQASWASENGLKTDTSLDDILLAQIEAHRTEVVYNLDPVRFPSAFLKRLPQSVKVKYAWRAAPSGNADFGGYDRLLCNFPSIMADYEKMGWPCAYFTPSHDPVMNTYAQRTNRPVDVLFVGGYSQYHMNRAEILDAVAALGRECRVEYHMYRSRLTKLADTPLGIVGPLRKYRTPASVLKILKPPIFGRDYYDALSRAKIVLNIATEIAGQDRGNMRCWEAMGCGSALLTDTGNYPVGMNLQSMLTYVGRGEVVQAIRRLLQEPEKTQDMARTGFDMVSSMYSKERQWAAFQALL
jgi:Glycosyl transferases group 1